MTNSNSNPSAIAELGAKCIAHLEKEETSLQNFIETARHVQELIIEGKAVDETKSIDLEKAMQNNAGQLAVERESLRTEIARVLNKPANAVSIKVLASQVDAESRQEILQRRERVIELTKTIERINRTNTVLIHQTIDLQQRLQLAITGKDHSATTYGASGRLDSQPASSVIETEC